MIGNKQLEKIICVACTEPFGEHTKRGLIRCIFRLQGTLVSDGIQNKEAPDNVKGFNTGVG
tara:strand:+ start:152 stop:334 length:183 start_codon:yes stop_codon:yes gene_type:complete